MKISCPRCGRDTFYQGNPYRPFCSQRCKQIDLGNWVSEKYRVPSRTQDEEEDGTAQSPTGPPER